MGKFLAIVVGTVALGLALRFTVMKKKAPAHKPTASTTAHSTAVPPPAPQPSTPEVKPPAATEAATAVEPEPKPEPPRIEGTIQLADTSSRDVATVPGLLYYCDQQQDLMVVKKDGSRDPQRVGDCQGAIVGDTNGIFYCTTDDKLMRVTPGAAGSHTVTDMQCIPMGLDDRYVYFVQPGFDDAPNPGVYRVARAGGTPELLHARAKEQFGVDVDSDAIWIHGYFLGQVYRLDRKPGSKPKLVLGGQKNMEDLAVDAQYLYWYVEDGTGDLRRRRKTGGPIETLGHNVTYPIQVVDGHVYWFELQGDKTTKLVHLAPGAKDPTVMASGLRTPSMTADSEGVYVSELDLLGIFMFKR